MLSIGQGARRQEMSTVRPDSAILMSLGAPDATQSSLSAEVAHSLYGLPGIRVAPGGRPIAVSEVFVNTNARRRGGGTLMPFRLVGATDGLTYLMPEMHLVAGRMFKSGLNELISSDACGRLFSGFRIGETRVIGGTRWLVVGNFALGRSDVGCIAYADATAVMSAFKLNDYNQVGVMLTSPGELPRLAAALKAAPTLLVDARSEGQVVRDEYRSLNGILDFAAYFVGGIMAIGATLGAANAMYAIIDGRRRELATLKASDSGPGPSFSPRSRNRRCSEYPAH
jgi:putative ABC transport system permease protein